VIYEKRSDRSLLEKFPKIPFNRWDGYLPAEGLNFDSTFDIVPEKRLPDVVEQELRLFMESAT